MEAKRKRNYMGERSVGIIGGTAETPYIKIKEQEYVAEEINQTSEMEVSNLDGICAYFPLVDCFNLKIFARKKRINSDNQKKKMKDEISNRLLMALLLYDHVLMHCSDPLRAEIVFEVLSSYVDFIDNGSILFVFSNKIVNISNDYQRYIENKSIEYSENDFSKADINSLNQKHITDDYFVKVIELLNHTPIMLKKGKEGRLGFKTLIQNDLVPNGQEIAIIGNDNNYTFSHMRLLNLTLYQLLHLKYYKNGKIIEIFDEGKVEDFLRVWNESCKQGDSFSRHTIVEQLNKECVEHKKTKRGAMQKEILDAIEIRLSILYSHLNCGSHHIIDFNPSTEKISVHNIDNFNLYVRKIAKREDDVKLTSEIVRNIRRDKEWKNFRYEFFSCMSEMSTLANISQRRNLDDIVFFQELLEDIFQKHFPEGNQRYSSIKDILNCDL